jgi:tRNA pseudouridine38-40 synthase
MSLFAVRGFRSGFSFKTCFSSDMPRYKLTIEYDGTPYAGWQWQKDHLSVQQVLEEAIEKFAGHPVRLHCAGRTDAGVHATCQVIHVDLVKSLRPGVVRDAANAYLRFKSIAVVEAELADNDFHARFHARKRRYLYRILNRRAPSALDSSRVWHVPKPLDVKAMHEAAQVLVGYHDFTSFRAMQCQAKSPFKTLEELRVAREIDEIHVHASSKSFLHHQVRSMVGTLMLAGSGRITRDAVHDILEAKDRTRCGPMAPAHGLYLVDVEY